MTKRKIISVFIAQEIKEILPEKFEAVVNEDNDFMGLNYGKMSAVLWKALQEQILKNEEKDYMIEHLFMESITRNITTKTNTE